MHDLLGQLGRPFRNGESLMSIRFTEQLPRGTTSYFISIVRVHVNGRAEEFSLFGQLPHALLDASKRPLVERLP